MRKNNENLKLSMETTQFSKDFPLRQEGRLCTGIPTVCFGRNVWCTHSSKLKYQLLKQNKSADIFKGEF